MSEEDRDEERQRAFMHPQVRLAFEAIERLAERVSAGEAETQNKIDFILEQQAQLTANVEKLTAKVDRNADSVAALLTITQIQADEIKDLGESVRRVDTRQREADERLNILVNTVERYISEGRNGKG